MSDRVSFVLDLRVVHDRVDSCTDPVLNGHLRYPNNLDQSLNDSDDEKYVDIALTTVIIRPGV